METWTEYAADVDGRIAAPFDTRYGAEEWVRYQRSKGYAARLVGRQVTASDWLPVDQDGAS